eukprot:jgi/Chrzof1/8673/Cz03g20020.t1
MGLWDKLLDLLGLNGQKANVLVIGLDNSGKTTTIERLKPRSKQSIEVAPTVGFSVDEFQRGVVARDELDTMLSNPQLPGRVPLLFLANKKDLPTALPPVEIAQALGLDDIREHPWQIVPTNALTGDGLDRAVDWLADRLLRKN